MASQMQCWEAGSLSISTQCGPGEDSRSLIPASATEAVTRADKRRCKEHSCKQQRRSCRPSTNLADKRNPTDNKVLQAVVAPTPTSKATVVAAEGACGARSVAFLCTTRIQGPTATCSSRMAKHAGASCRMAERRDYSQPGSSCPTALFIHQETHNFEVTPAGGIAVG